MNNVKVISLEKYDVKILTLFYTGGIQHTGLAGQEQGSYQRQCSTGATRQQRASGSLFLR